MKLLLDYGMDINYSENDHAATALIRSVIHKHNDIVEFLLDNGADPNIKTDMGFTALDFANDNNEAIIMLKSHGGKNGSFQNVL
jgi:ankyrin repeat protein